MNSSTPALLLILCVAASSAATEPASLPSKVENPVKEADLPLLKITPQAEQRLATLLGSKTLERTVVLEVRIQKAKTMHEKFGVVGNDVFFAARTSPSRLRPNTRRTASR